jgi:hypothetical protein
MGGCLGKTCSLTFVSGASGQLSQIIDLHVSNMSAWVMMPSLGFPHVVAWVQYQTWDSHCHLCVKEKCLGIHVSSLFDFNENWKMSTNFCRIPQYQIS